MSAYKRARFVRLVRVAVLLVAAVLHANHAAAKSGERVTATLGGFEFVLDADTGGILQLSAPGVGTLLDTTADAASLVDLACPVEEFGPLRLAARYSQGAKITKSSDQVVVHWDALGASRSFVRLPGKVSATVTLKAAPDGKSVVMTCTIENQSGNPVRQVLFPDLLGLAPTAGAAGTEFRSGRQVVKPFVQLASPQQDEFFARNSVFLEFQPGKKKDPTLGRWIGYGSARGGFSLFAAGGAPAPGSTVMLHLWEKNNKLRLMCAHRVDIAAGATWQSSQYWLTPYKLGWDEAAEPYHAWAKQHGNRKGLSQNPGSER